MIDKGRHQGLNHDRTKAPAATIANAISPVSPERVLQITEALLSIPAFDSAVAHYVAAWQAQDTDIRILSHFAQEMRLAGADLIRLVTDRDQREQVIKAFQDVGVTLRNSTIAFFFRENSHVVCSNTRCNRCYYSDR